MEHKEAIEALIKWQEADDYKRTIIVLVSECTDEDKNSVHYSSSIGLDGTDENIVSTFKGAFKNCPNLLKLISRAVKELAVELNKNTEKSNLLN